jgi:hypothetical protein
MAILDSDLEGKVRCYCGAKYWENGICVDCGLDIYSLDGQALLMDNHQWQYRLRTFEQSVRG